MERDSGVRALEVVVVVGPFCETVEEGRLKNTREEWYSEVEASRGRRGLAARRLRCVGVRVTQALSSQRRRAGKTSEGGFLLKRQAPG